MEVGTLETALFGLRKQLERFHESATRVTENGPGEGLAADLVDLKVQQRGVEAGVTVVKAADETLGTLLDVVR